MSDPNLRLMITMALLAAFVIFEHIAPARANVLNVGRIANQAGLALISSVLAKVALGGGLASLADYARLENIGVFNVISVPVWVSIAISFLVLDFAIWAQHLVLHRVPFLWRLHRVHHGDIVMDVSTALRFHPFEILVSLAYKSCLIMALGAPVLAVLAFEIVLGAGALFTHANIAVPPWLERYLRLALVTPSLHLIHHSPNPLQTNSNFGFSFNFWDRLFGTYRPIPLDDNPNIGLENWRSSGDQTLGAMLANPFK